MADPAYRGGEDGGCRIFAEHLDHRGRGQGEIWRADLSPGEDLTHARFAPLLAMSSHCSYPFPIRDQTGRRLLSVETSQRGETLLWEEGENLRLLGSVMCGRPVIDPTFWCDGGTWYLFCGLGDYDPERGLFVFHARSLRGPWIPHPGNPVARGRAGSRPGGPLFEAGGRLIRPGQDCSRTYGGALLLFEVTRLSRWSYEERLIRRLAPLPGPYPHGLHTFCPAGRVTLIDGKSYRYTLSSAARKTRRLIRGWRRGVG